MVSFFTDPYPDELIYSAVARYHFYTGNIDFKDTIEEIFRSRSVIPSVGIGSHLKVFPQQLKEYTIETLLGKHTIDPFYAPFLSKDRQQEIRQDVEGNGKGLYTRLGMVAGGICKKKALYYCSYCAQNDIDIYGEPYIHREHQLQGIDLCPHHHSQLNRYPIDLKNRSRIEFIRFDAKHMIFTEKEEVVCQDYQAIQIKLANMAYQLMQVDISKFSREIVSNKYRFLLREQNLITASNRVRQEELFKAFTAKFPKGFLELYESDINVEDEYNWLKVLTRNLVRHVHPFRHLLFLYFLHEDIESFLQVNEDKGPFGRGPWPCLNIAASHYRENVISNVVISRDFKTNNPIGTFECSCGFIYARKGPDNIEEDKFSIGKVKEFGEIWKLELNTLAHNGTLSYRGIGRKLGVDSKTVKKYLEDEREEFPQSKVHNTMLSQYKAELLEKLSKNPIYSRTQIQKEYPKLYMYLYRHDKEWLFEHLPKQSKKESINKVVNWSARDKEYYNLIEQLYKELMELEKPVRLTISLIGRRLGILSNLERNLDKLPHCTEFLNKITESVQQFQIRRCYKVIDQMISKQETVLLWKVQRIAGVKSHHFLEIKSYLDEYLFKKQEVNRYE